MEAEVEARFQRIQALLRAGAEHGEELERRFNRRMDAAEKRAKLAEKRAQERLDRADERIDKFDKRLELTRQMVETGMKLMIRMSARLDALTKRGDRNGHGRTH